ncbi:MAG: phage portal protein [Campylobacter sp.]|nr:phage portal protein [Campylobacter sp.]
MEYIFYKSSSKQKIVENDSVINNIIEPFISFDRLLDLSYTNVYHKRALNLKATVLSTIDETNLNEFLPSNINETEFLKGFVYNLELFGTAAIEKAGKMLYLLPTQELRISKDYKIYQKTNSKITPLDGFYLKYHSSKSRYYGEPDYLDCINAILLNSKADTYNNTFFDNGARPDIAIIFENSEPSKEQISAFKEFFSKDFKGVNNAHKALLVFGNNGVNDSNAKIRFEKLGGVDDLSFKKLKNVVRDEIVAAHGVPPRLVGVVQGNGLGGSGELMGQLHQFNELVIKPKIETIEYFFNEILGVKLSLKAIDVTNFKDDSTIITSLVQNGIVSIDEARDLLGWQKNIG